jgi:hypothetical protein
LPAVNPVIRCAIHGQAPSRSRSAQGLVASEGDPIATNSRWALNLVAKLIGLAPKGLYALSIYREGRTPEIHCVFEKDTDALKLANAVQPTALAVTPAGGASARSRSIPRLAGQSPRP